MCMHLSHSHMYMPAAFAILPVWAHFYNQYPAWAEQYCNTMRCDAMLLLGYAVLRYAIDAMSSHASQYAPQAHISW